MPGGDVVSSGARYPGVSGRSSYRPSPRPPARPSVFQNLAHAIANVGSSVQHATHVASAPHGRETNSPAAQRTAAMARTGLFAGIGRAIGYGGRVADFQARMLSDPQFRAIVQHALRSSNPFDQPVNERGTITGGPKLAVEGVGDTTSAFIGDLLGPRQVTYEVGGAPATRTQITEGLFGPTELRGQDIAPGRTYKGYTRPGGMVINGKYVPPFHRNGLTMKPVKTVNGRIVTTADKFTP